MDENSLVKFYGKIIAVQGSIYWTDKYIVIQNNEISTAILRNPPEEFIINNNQKDIPGQQNFLDGSF